MMANTSYKKINILSIRLATKLPPFFKILFNFFIFFEINTLCGRSFFLKTFLKIVYNSDCLEIKVVKGCY